MANTLSTANSEGRSQEALIREGPQARSWGLEGPRDFQLNIYCIEMKQVAPLLSLPKILE